MKFAKFLSMEESTQKITKLTMSHVVSSNILLTHTESKHKYFYL